MADELQELSNDLYETQTDIEVLDGTLKDSRLTKYTGLVTKGGKLKGHLTGLTAKQYKKVIGRAPRPELLVKARDATTKKVPYELVLDQIADELGYHGTRGEERLKDDIERTKQDQEKLEKLKAHREIVLQKLNDEIGEAISEKPIKSIGRAPLFPENTAKVESIAVNGTEFTMRRQHSFWQLEINGQPALQIRYADESRKMIDNLADSTAEGYRPIKPTRRKRLASKSRKRRDKGDIVLKGVR